MLSAPSCHRLYTSSPPKYVPSTSVSRIGASPTLLESRIIIAVDTEPVGEPTHRNPSELIFIEGGKGSIRSEATECLTPTQILRWVLEPAAYGARARRRPVGVVAAARAYLNNSRLFQRKVFSVISMEVPPERALNTSIASPGEVRTLHVRRFCSPKSAAANFTAARFVHKI